MATLADRIRATSDLSHDEAERLRALCSSWQVLADLSFSDLLLYVRNRGEDTFEVVAQLRPFTSQTLYPNDMVGTRFTQPEQPAVERAFREGRIWGQHDPVLVDGIPISMEAVPVHYRGNVIGVVTKEGSPATSRRPGRLEQVYLEAADHVSKMICAGLFPYADRPRAEWLRVSDGLFVLDAAGRTTWASPNALSSLRRLGVTENVLGRLLDELDLGETPVRDAISSGGLAEGELVRGDNHVRLLVMPLLDASGTQGALALARDVSEVRQKERVISVKEASIREIHHRVKNNLQTIASLLRLQARRLNSEEARAALEESVLRISSIALVHETLSEDPADVAEFGDVARRVAQMVGEGLVLPGRGIEIDVRGSTGPLGANVATPLAVTVTELLQNAVEHAFPDGNGGGIRVELSRHDSDAVVVVADDGVGLPSEMLDGDGSPPKGARLGLQIVRSLVEELGGRLQLSSNGGTRVEVVVPTSR